MVPGGAPSISSNCPNSVPPHRVVVFRLHRAFIRFDARDDLRALYEGREHADGAPDFRRLSFARKRVRTSISEQSRADETHPTMSAPPTSTAASPTSRVQAIVFTTLEGYVIYETYYEQLNDIQKCEVRQSFDTISTNHELRHGSELVGRFKNGKVSGLVCGAVVGYALGTGYCDELMLSSFLERMFEVLVEVMDVDEVKGRPAMDGGVLVGNYDVLCHVVDAMCVDGVVEEVGVEGVRKSLVLGSEKWTGGGRGLRGVVRSLKSSIGR